MVEGLVLVTTRRFPSPWSIEELEACFVVIDSAGQKLAYVYFEDEPGRRWAAKLLSKRMRRDVSRRTLLSWDWRNEMASAKHQLW